MDISIKGGANEISSLILALQERRDNQGVQLDAKKIMTAINKAQRQALKTENILGY